MRTVSPRSVFVAIAVAALESAADPAAAASNNYNSAKSNSSIVTAGQGMQVCGDPIPGLDISLEQVPGGFAAPSATTEGGGFQSCTPVQTCDAQAGDPADGWLFAEGGSASFQAKVGKNSLVDPLNPVGDTADVALSFKVQGLVEDAVPATGVGAYVVVARISMDDRAGGNMTLIDLPMYFPIEVAGGKGSHKSSLNLKLNEIGESGLPLDAGIQFLPQLRDANSNTLGTAMVIEDKDLLPSATYSTTKSNIKNQKFIQAVVPCGVVGGNIPNTQTEGGVPACAPVETFHEQNGSPAGGWLFAPGGSAQLKMKAGKNKVVHALNPAANSGDVTVQLKMKGIVDSMGPATSNGQLQLDVRIALNDRDGGHMNTVIVPLTVAVSVVGGKASLKSSLNAILNAAGRPGLPTTFAVQVVSVRIVDPLGSTFGVPGVVVGDLDAA